MNSGPGGVAWRIMEMTGRRASVGASPRSTTDPMVSLRLFGGASLEGVDGALTGPAAQRHRLALLALLALPPARALTRDKLMALLWPERDAEHARNLLNQSVYVLRKALGEDAIASSGEELRLDTGTVHCDVVAFQEALADGDLERAVDLYTGPFLDGFSLSAAAEFEHWADRERARLADARAQALETLAEAAEARRDMRTAVTWWKDRAAHDPYDSRVALRLMHALVAAGNPAGALRHASEHERLLREELALEPPADIAALADRLRREPVPPVQRSRPDEQETGERAPAAAASSGARVTPSAAPDPALSPPTGAPRSEGLGSPIRYAVAVLLLAAGAVLAATQLGLGSSDARTSEAESSIDVDRVADEVADAVERRLGGNGSGRRPEDATAVPAAREFFRRGNDPSVLRSDSAARQALADCKEAVALDSMYAAAWACVARMRMRVSTKPGTGRTPAEMHGAAEEAALKAVALNDSLAEAHAVLGWVRMAELDFDAAEEKMERAVELDPDNSLLHQWLVAVYLWTKGPAAALDAAERGLALDSASASANAEYARALAANGRCDDAIAWIQRELQALPSPLLRVPGIIARCHARHGRWEHAIAVLRTLPDHETSPHTQGLRGYFHARAGHTGEALRIRRELEDRWRNTGIGSFPVAMVWAGLGDADQVYEWLDRAIRDRSLAVVPIGPESWSMVLEPLRGDPLLEDLRERFGLPAL